MKIKFLNSLIFFAILILFANFLLNACVKGSEENQDTIVQSVPKLQGVIFEDGRLKFESEHSFSSAKSLMLLHQNNMKAFEKQFPAFESSHSAYLRLSNSGELTSLENLPQCMTVLQSLEGETYVRPSVDFHVLDHLANKEGIYQVGQTVFKITYYNVYKSNVKFVDMLKSKMIISDPNIEILPISRESKEIKYRNELAECEWFYDEGSRKFHGEVKSRIYPGYAQISVDFDHYRKRFGIWWANDAPFMSFSGTLSSDCCEFSTPEGLVSGCCPTVGGNPCTFTPSFLGSLPICTYGTSASGRDQSEIFDVIMDRDYGSHYHLGSPTNITFTGIGDDGVKRTCSIIR